MERTRAFSASISFAANHVSRPAPVQGLAAFAPSDDSIAFPSAHALHDAGAGTAWVQRGRLENNHT